MDPESIAIVVYDFTYPDGGILCHAISHSPNVVVELFGRRCIGPLEWFETTGMECVVPVGRIPTRLLGPMDVVLHGCDVVATAVANDVGCVVAGLDRLGRRPGPTERPGIAHCCVGLEQCLDRATTALLVDDGSVVATLSHGGCGCPIDIHRQYFIPDRIPCVGAEGKNRLHHVHINFVVLEVVHL
jgi:hypothetical protein